MCHMWSDHSEDELMQMADRIGVARKWIQRPPKASWVHFDISLGCKAKAIAYGAVLTDKYGPVVHTTGLRREWALKHGDLAMVLRCDTMLKNIERMRTDR